MADPVTYKVSYGYDQSKAADWSSHPGWGSSVTADATVYYDLTWDASGNVKLMRDWTPEEKIAMVRQVLMLEEGERVVAVCVQRSDGSVDVRHLG